MEIVWYARKNYIFNGNAKMTDVIIEKYAHLIDGKINHPSVKPSTLIEFLLKNHSNENDIILDPFAGSGTTAIACIRNDRKFILIEREKDYCEIIKKRIESELSVTIPKEYRLW